MDMDPRIALYYMCEFAGLAMIVGGIWLLYSEKIYLDSESKQPVEIETPLGKFKANYPALALFALGFVPLVYPIYSLRNLTDYVKVDMVNIRGGARATAYPAVVYVAGAQDSLTPDGKFKIPVPFIKGNQSQYRLLLVLNDQVLDSARVDRDEQSEVEVAFRPVEVEPSLYTPQLSEIPAAYR
jgi:hypothetical protein